MLGGSDGGVMMVMLVMMTMTMTMMMTTTMTMTMVMTMTTMLMNYLAFIEHRSNVVGYTPIHECRNGINTFLKNEIK